MGMLAAASLSVPALADDSKITKGYNTMDSMGCMDLRECTDGVEQITSLLIFLVSIDILLGLLTFLMSSTECSLLAQVGVKVFLAPILKVFSDWASWCFIIL